jgi:hypothetical protein
MYYEELARSNNKMIMRAEEEGLDVTESIKDKGIKDKILSNTQKDFLL